MPLAPGTRLGPYAILTPLGAGGMGEVYRARDTKLDREVAIKILPDALARDPDRLARFEREAKVLAALNHPNIAQIYGLEERALVMELVEGQTLAGPLPLETALNYARQIADALESAHEKGVVHRDLKPANVMVTPAGVVKVLDFGLAAVLQGSTSGSGDPMSSPTITMRATQAGVIMGTAAYMSPEQAAGKPVDRRADIWSFGVVLFEMLTGQRMFEGETVSHTLAGVLKDPIDFSRLPPETPAAIRELLRRCLDRDVKNRLRDIGEARVAIGRYLADPKSGTEVSGPGAPRLKPATHGDGRGLWLRASLWRRLRSAMWRIGMLLRRRRRYYGSRCRLPKKGPSPLMVCLRYRPTDAASLTLPSWKGRTNCGFATWIRSRPGLWLPRTPDLRSGRPTDAPSGFSPEAS
jgi:serine/threonine protein kinase